MKHWLKPKRRNKRGFSIVECAVCLTMLVLLGTAVISVVMSSQTIGIRKEAYFTTRSLADNALQCFRYADTNEEFSEQMTTMLATAGVEPQLTNGSDVYQFTASDYTLKITVDYAVGRPLYSAVAKDGRGRQLFEVSYEKAN